MTTPTETKIVIGGEGGQGIQVVATTLANTFKSLDYNVMITFDYAPAVRGGKSTAMITASKGEIKNPIIDQADIMIKLSPKAGEYTGKELYCDEAICSEGETPLPLTKLATEKLKNKMFAGMIGVGFIFAKLGFDLDSLNFDDFLPSKFRPENKKAIELGCELASRKT